MAYDKSKISLWDQIIEGGIKEFIYVTTDTLAQVQAAGYVSNATDLRLFPGDLVHVFAGTAFSTTGLSLGAEVFPAPTVGVSNYFTGTPVYRLFSVSAVAAGTTAAPGAGTLVPAMIIPSDLLSNPRNLLDGADATINPWQRGTSLTNIGATNTYTADRWFMVGGAGSSATMVKTANTGIPGFSQAFVWGRGQSSGSVSTITVGQALESLDSIRAQGQAVTFSFYAASNTGFAAGVSGSVITALLVQGFGTDQSASALVNGTWTSQATIVSAPVTLTTTYNGNSRFSISGAASLTATQLGVLFQYTPTSTTATTAENVIMNGMQLEIGGTTPFEHREIEQELAYCQRYFFQMVETGTSGTVLGAGMIAGTNTALFVLQLPVQMRAAPTVTVTNGSFGAEVIGAYVALTSMAAGSTHTVNYVSVTGALTAVSGQATMLISSSAAVGKIQVSADL